MMTNFHQVLAQCPICLNEETMTIWDTIDASTDPDLREKLLHKTLQSLECRNCGNSTLIASPLTYIDPEFDLLIECRPDLDRGQLLEHLKELQREDSTLRAAVTSAQVIDDANPAGSAEPAEPAVATQFRRLTATTNDLIEKILIREQDLDDQALEIVKLAVINHGASEVSVEELRFVGVAANELNFVMKLEDGWFQYALPLEAYANAELILKQLGATTKAADREFALVDRAYAEEMLAAFTTAMSDQEAP